MNYSYSVTTATPENVPSMKLVAGIAISMGMVLSAFQTDVSGGVISSPKNSEFIYGSSIPYVETEYNSYVYSTEEGITLSVRSKADNYRTIEEIRGLAENWNDNGAVAFSDAIICKAKEIVDSLDIQPEIFPTANDSIQFEFENANDDYLEFELFEDGKLKMFYYGADGVSKTEYIDMESLNEVVIAFYGNKIGI